MVAVVVPTEAEIPVGTVPSATWAVFAPKVLYIKSSTITDYQNSAEVHDVRRNAQKAFELSSSQ